MGHLNKYDFSRDIPVDVKRQVRKNSGNGCIFCGLFLYQYEHVVPGFHDASEHDPDRITLLCPNHHQRVTKGLIPKQRVLEQMENPVCKKKGYSNEFIELGRDQPKFVFAGSMIEQCSIPVEIQGKPLFQITPPDEDGGPILLNGTFNNRHGHRVLEIVDNEWRVNSGKWDLEYIGTRLIIKDRIGDGVYIPSFQVNLELPHTIVVEKINTQIEGMRIRGDEKRLLVNSNEFSNCYLSNCAVGFSLG